MRKLGWVMGLAFAAAGGVGVGCGEPFTTTGGTGGGTSSASSTSTGMGGSGGMSASASASTGTGGQGGAVVATASSSSSSGAPACSPTSCAMGSYCDSNSGACVACTDFTRFHFGTPLALTVTLPALVTARFPRLAPDGTMYFTYTDAGGSILASAPYQMFPVWGKATVLPSPPNPATSAGADYLGPLFLPDASVLKGIDASIPSGSLLLYDIPVAKATGGTVRKIFAYSVSAGGPSVQMTLPGTSSATGEWRIAVAPDTQRIWWLSTSVGSSGGLLTAKGAASAPVAVAVPLDDGMDALPNQPWVTPDGKVLLIATTYASGKDPIPHLFHTGLDPQSGLPKGKATRIFPMDATSIDSDPALVGNACALLFTRNGALWGALRD